MIRTVRLSYGPPVLVRVREVSYLNAMRGNCGNRSAHSGNLLRTADGTEIPLGIDIERARLYHGNADALQEARHCLNLFCIVGHAGVRQQIQRNA